MKLTRSHGSGARRTRKTAVGLSPAIRTVASRLQQRRRRRWWRWRRRRRRRYFWTRPHPADSLCVKDVVNTKRRQPRRIQKGRRHFTRLLIGEEKVGGVKRNDYNNIMYAILYVRNCIRLRSRIYLYFIINFFFFFEWIARVFVEWSDPRVWHRRGSPHHLGYIPHTHTRNSPTIGAEYVL